MEIDWVAVLQRLMQDESRWQINRAKYKDEMRRLAERSKTKCERCGHMTQISRR